MPDDVEAAALAAVHTYCGWHIAPEVEETLTLDGPGAGVLLLPSLHVVGITSIIENGVELDPATYQWSESGLVRKGLVMWTTHIVSRWTAAYRGIEVSLTHGYAQMPADVQSVVDALAKRMSASVPAGVTQKAIGPFSESYNLDLGSITQAESHTLDLYRLPWRP